MMCGPCIPGGLQWPITTYGFLSCFHGIPLKWGGNTIVSLANISCPSDVVMIFDASTAFGCVGSSPWTNVCQAWCTPSLQVEENCRHNGGNNYAFVDGHVKWLKSEYAYAHAADLGWHGPPW